MMSKTAPHPFARAVAIWNTAPTGGPGAAKAAAASPAERTAVFQRVISFYSHTRREEDGAREDAELGINRLCFSNLFPCTIHVSAHVERTAAAAAGVSQLLIHKELVDIDYSSTENLFQAAKCANLCDALFVAHALDSREAAMFGQGRMTLSDAHRERLIKYGANPDDFQRAKSNSWKRTASGYPLMREDWDSIKPYVMMTALRLKFDVPSVGAAIVQTGAQEAVNSLTALAARDENILLVEHVDRDRQWGDGLLGEGTNMLGKMLTQLLWEKRHDCTYPLDLAWLRRPNNTVAEYP